MNSSSTDRFLRKFALQRLILFCFGFLLYANCINHEYNFDDYLVTGRNQTVQKGFQAIPEILTTNYVTIPGAEADYRPLGKVSYAIEHQFFGSKPQISHLINAILFAFCCLLLFNSLRFVVDSPGLVFITSMLFAAHPVHTEVVASLKNREEMMAMCFGLLYFIAACQISRKLDLKLFARALIWLILGILSKLTAIIFIGWCGAHLIVNRKQAKKGQLLLFFGSITCLIIYFALVLTLLPVYTRPLSFVEAPLQHINDWGIQTATIARALLGYLEMLIWPVQQQFYYGFNEIAVQSWGDMKSLFGLLLHLIIVAGTLACFWWNRNLFWAGFIYLSGIFLFANIVFPNTGIVSERAILIASVGWCLLIALILQKMYAFRPAVSVIAFAMLLLLYSLATINRNSDWKNEESLYSADRFKVHDSAKAQQVIAHFMRTQAKQTRNTKQRGKYLKQAKTHFEKSIEIYPDWALTRNSYGLLLAQDFRSPKQAIPEFKRAVELDSTHLKATYNLAMSYRLIAEHDSARYFYKKVLKIQPTHEKSLHALEQYRTGRF